MADDTTNFERLGEHVVARRVALGYKKRPAFSEASGISTRILGDIETGRRGNFDPTTIAALENTLGWTTGSVTQILEGGEPVIRNQRTVNASAAAVGVSAASATASVGRDEALIRVMRSEDLTEDQKRRIVQMLIAERVAFDRQIAERAEQLIDLMRGQG